MIWYVISVGQELLHTNKNVGQGLGKTVQVSSFVYGLFCSGLVSQVLIIAPLAVMDTWKRELSCWAPKVRVVQYHGTAAQRREALSRVYSRGGVVLTTYGVFVCYLFVVTFINIAG